MAQTPQNSVIRSRNKAVREASTTDYDREQMQAYGFIYADGSYSDERQPRGATIVPRRPSADHMWDPDDKKWYVVHENTSDARETASGVAGVGQILPDRQAGGPAPLVGISAEKAALEARLREIHDLEEGIRQPTPPKTDVYPTHSVAHSARGVVTSGDPAAAPNRPESVEFVGAGPAPSQDAVRAQMQADAAVARQNAGLQASGGETFIDGDAVRVEAVNRGIHNTGDEEDRAQGAVVQQGATNTTRGLTPVANAEGAAERGATNVFGNMSPQPQVKADTAKPSPAVSQQPDTNGLAGSNKVPKL